MTPREKAILDYMSSQIRRNGYPPAIREVCEALDIRSTSTVHKAIESLCRQGYIRKDPLKRRALEIIQTSEEEGPVRKDGPQHAEDRGRGDVVDIPVVGRIAAGTPILAEQNIEDTFPLPARYLGRGTSFMLTVHGESMIEAGINDGDYLLVEEQSSAENGDIVVALIDGIESEATVKAFYRENGHVRLQPRNSAMDPIIVPDCRIIGKVKGVFRYFN